MVRRLAVLTSTPAGMARLGVIMALVVALSACEDAGPSASQPSAGPPPVLISQPAQRNVTEWDEYTGRFEAVERVEIRARVSGFLDSIHFEDGQVVNNGDLLFVIDPRPFRIALQQAEAELAQARSRLDLAVRDVQRAEPLLRKNAISEQRYDERVSAQRAAQAALRAADASVAAARLNVEFTEVRSPVTGRISRNFVSVGNLISGGTAESTLLTTVVTLDPIHFYFDVDENAFLKYVRLSRTGERPSSRETANPVYLSLPDENDFRHLGLMDFIDNQMDFGTGTVRGRAIFPNDDLVFTPGLFARVRLLGSGEYAALMLPDSAIGTDQSRRFVYVVGDDGTVVYRPVELGPLVDGLRVVRKGLRPDDWVIVNGLQRARTGGQVTPERTTIEALPRAASLG